MNNTVLLKFERNPKLIIKKVSLLKETFLKKIIELIHKIFIFRKSVKATINRASGIPPYNIIILYDGILLALDYNIII